eukprot:TRINITY_DN2914_c0_g1_i1.p2 TRINITY_DN2914_c0_g1~~TRINITY_DN2914_c0_g1_i1.p2  ORF type:complete len:945 (-),score=108.06 TRINITY_DN2914_c0_g1_i1:6739-9573(-)
MPQLLENSPVVGMDIVRPCTSESSTFSVGIVAKYPTMTFLYSHYNNSSCKLPNTRFNAGAIHTMLNNQQEIKWKASTVSPLAQRKPLGFSFLRSTMFLSVVLSLTNSIVLKMKEEIGNEYDIKKDSSDILSMLEGNAYETLEEIKKYFSKGGEEGLTIDQFVYIMLCNLQHSTKEEEKRLVLSLIDLFEQIDVNGDQHLEWKEFTNHIIELGMVRKDNTYVDAIKNYKMSTKEDKDKHETEVKKLYYFDEIQQLISLERDSRKFKYYDVTKQKTKWRPKEGPLHTGTVLSAEYIPKWELLATTANDNSINFWAVKEDYAFKNRISTPEIQLCAEFNERASPLLYTGGCDSVIHAYDPNPENYCKEVMHTEPFNVTLGDDKRSGHTGQIMDLLIIPNQNKLVSAGMDKLICFWSLDKLELKKKLEGHKKGVYTLEWAEDIASLFTGGIEHDIYIWNPYVAERIFLLKGHNHSLAKIKYLPGTYQLVSADISGMVRVWDVRTFTTVQTFNVPLNEVHSLEVWQSPKTVVVGGKRLVFYEYDEPTDTNLADDESCLCILYNKVFFTFITAHPKSVKVWDAETGKLQSVFRDLTTREITSIALDKRQRKLFVGDSKGRVFSINVKNGALMKKFARHDNVTSSLVYCGETTRLMSAGWDSLIMVHDDKQSESQSESRTKFKKHEDQVNCLDYCEKEKLLASCSDDRTVLVYNLQTYRLEAEFKKHEAEVKVCTFLGDNGCLATGDMLGKICFWTVQPCLAKNTLIATVVNKVVTETKKVEKYPIKCMSFDETNLFLYTGDDMGYLQMWSCSDLIGKVKSLKKVPYHSKEEAGTFLTEQKEKELVPLVRQIRAHKEGITSVCFVKKPYCIATCGYDCMAYIWSPTFEKLGSLLIGQDRSWKLTVSKASRIRKQHDKAKRVMEKVESLNKESLFGKQTGAMSKEEKMGNII